MSKQSKFSNLRKVRMQALLAFLWAEYPQGTVLEHFKTGEHLKTGGLGPEGWSYKEIEQVVEDLDSCGLVKLRPSKAPGLVRFDLIAKPDSWAVSC